MADSVRGIRAPTASGMGTRRGWIVVDLHPFAARPASTATAEAIAEFEAKRADLEKAAAERLAAAQAQSEKLSGLRVPVSQKAGVDGRLFGSVTNHDISEALGKQGFTVDKSQIRMPNGPLKAVGEYPLAVSLHTDVIAEVVVVVAGE